jgi:hypothetical protein
MLFISETLENINLLGNYFPDLPNGLCPPTISKPFGSEDLFPVTYAGMIIIVYGSSKRCLLYIREKTRSHKTKNPLFHLVPCHEMLIIILNCLHIRNIILSIF